MKATDKQQLQTNSGCRQTAADEQPQTNSCRQTATVAFVMHCSRAVWSIDQLFCRQTVTDEQPWISSCRQTATDNQSLLHLLLEQNSLINWLIISQTKSHRQAAEDEQPLFSFVICAEQFNQLIYWIIIVILKVTSFIKAFSLIYSKDWLYEISYFFSLVDCRLFDLRKNKHILICKRLLSSWGHSIPVLFQS